MSWLFSYENVRDLQSPTSRKCWFFKKRVVKISGVFTAPACFQPSFDRLKNPNTYSDSPKIALSNDVEFIIILTLMKKISCIILLRMLAKALKFHFMIKTCLRIHEHGDIVGFVPKVLLYNMVYPEFCINSIFWHNLYFIDFLWIIIYLSQSVSYCLRTVVRNILKL